MTTPENKISSQFNGQNPEDFNAPMMYRDADQGNPSYNIGHRQLQDRTIYLHGGVNDQSAAQVISQLKYLNSIAGKDGNESTDITLVINSPGGSVTAGMAIYDVMRNIDCDVATLGIGLCASMGSFLLSAGTPGKRMILPNTEDMVHQPSAGSQGQVSEMQTSQYNAELIKRKMRMLYASFMGMEWDQFKKHEDDIEQLGDRDSWLSATAALKIGLVDHIIPPSGYGTDPNVTREHDMAMKFQEQDLHDMLNADDRIVPKHMRCVGNLIKAQEEIKKAAAKNDNKANKGGPKPS